MPLKVMDVVEQRLRMVAEVVSGRLSVGGAAALFAVSRSTLHEWLARYRGGWRGRAGAAVAATALEPGGGRG